MPAGSREAAAVVPPPDGRGGLFTGEGSPPRPSLPADGAPQDRRPGERFEPAARVSGQARERVHHLRAQEPAPEQEGAAEQRRPAVPVPLTKSLALQGVVAPQVSDRLPLLRNPVLDRSVGHPPARPARREERADDGRLVAERAALEPPAERRVVREELLLARAHDEVRAVGQFAPDVKLERLAAQVAFGEHRADVTPGGGEPGRRRALEARAD